MLKRVIDTSNNLKFLTNSFPADDENHKPMRESFLASIEHLQSLRSYLEKEEHEGLTGAKAPGDECPCTSCKTERFLEVLTNLSREQLLEIIASESGIDLETSQPCKVVNAEPPKNEIVMTESTPS